MENKDDKAMISLSLSLPPPPRSFRALLTNTRFSKAAAPLCS